MDTRSCACKQLVDMDLSISTRQAGRRRRTDNHGDNAMEIKRIEPEEAKELLDSTEDYTYLDVRTAEEFEAGHVPGSINVPVMLRNPAGPGMMPNPEFLQAVETELEKDRKIITACLRGGRSLKAAHILIQSGYENVVDMRGGYDGELDPGGNVVFPGWARRGLPTTTD